MARGAALALVDGDARAEVGPVALDDIEPILNPVQRADLETILRLTLPERRVAVALKFCGFDLTAWAAKSGFTRATSAGWVYHQYRMPFGGAVRLAAVLGVDPLLLFEAYV